MLGDLLKYSFGLNADSETLELTIPLITKQTTRPDSSLEDREMCRWAGSQYPVTEILPESGVNTVFTVKREAFYVFVR